MLNRCSNCAFSRWVGYSLLALSMVSGWTETALADAAVHTLRLGHLLRQDSIHGQKLIAIANDVEREGVAHLILIGQKPGKGAIHRLTAAVRKGEFDMAIVPLAALAPYDDVFQQFSTPFATHFWCEAGGWCTDRHGYLENDRLSKSGLKAIGGWPGEVLVLAARAPILEPSDLSGLRVVSLSSRARGEYSAFRSLRKKVGFMPVVMPSTQLGDAFRKGKVDVLEATITDLARLQISGLSVTLTNHLGRGLAVIVNVKKWNRLPKITRDGLETRLREASAKMLYKIIEDTHRAVRLLEVELGAAFLTVPSTVHDTWLASFSYIPVYSPTASEMEVSLKSFGFSGPLLRREISWNAWFESGPEYLSKEHDTLELNRVYRFNLDLARYAYDDLYTARLGVPTDELFQESGERELLLQPVLLGSEISPAPGHALSPKKVAVKLNRANISPRDADVLEKFYQRNLTTRALSNEVNLGGFASWDIKAQEVGCGSIAVTVWDLAKVTPLDHVMVQIPIRSKGMAPVDCRFDGSRSAMRAGLRTLLDSPAAPPGSRTADAAFHIFEDEPRDGTNSHAVFLHRKRLLAALENPALPDHGVYSWELKSALGRYVSDEHELPALIRKAHEAVAQPALRPFPYEDVASELALKLFSGANSYDQIEANKARSALHEVVDNTEHPVVLVRMVSGYREVQYLPLGLLSARGSLPELQKPFTVIQPLPDRRPGAKECIGRWSIAMPRELQGLTGDARDLLKEATDAAPPAGMEPIRNHAALAKYFAANRDGSIGRPEGLILLAHHDLGYLSFNDADRPPSRISREHILRSFAPGSAAVLAACATAGNTDAVRAIADQMMNKGFDALVASPFAVDAEFGTRLAIEFEKVLTDKKAKHEAATLLEVFEHASKGVAASYKSAGAGDMALEFILIGDPDVRLCP